MNAGDQACPETKPCPHPSPGGKKPARILAGKADGTDVLLENVEFQHRHAAQLNTHANGIAERWAGSCRRDLLDHIIAADERHLKRLLSEYIRYYHEDRTHLGLGKGTPDGRTRAIASSYVLSHVRLGGLHTGTIELPNPKQRRVVKTSGFLHPYIYTGIPLGFPGTDSWRSRVKG